MLWETQSAGGRSAVLSVTMATRATCVAPPDRAAFVLLDRDDVQRFRLSSVEDINFRAWKHGGKPVQTDETDRCGLAPKDRDQFRARGARTLETRGHYLEFINRLADDLVVENGGKMASLMSGSTAVSRLDLQC